VKQNELVSPISGNVLKHFLQAKDYLYTKETFDLYHDEDWDMLVTHPIPDNLEKYYETKFYKPHQHQNKKSILNRIYNLIRNFSYRQKYRLIKSYHSKATSVLDYGTATGEFLQYMTQKSFKVSGIEPNETARREANKKLNSQVRVSIEEIQDRFDIITLWHVLEHVQNLDELIEQLKKKLNSDGILLIAVPNFKSFDAKHYKKYWAAYDLPRHIWHFSPQSIRKLFKKHQCRIIGEQALYFDSFYVSLLSEQYRSGHKNIIKGFYNGLISNLKAIRSKNYSSKIYVIKKI